MKKESKIFDLLKDEQVSKLYLALFQRFSVYDIKHLYPGVHKILDILFERIADKSQFVCSLFSEYLLQSNTIFSQKNVITFIRSMKNINFNEVITGFAEMFKISILNGKSNEDARSMVVQDIDEIIVKLT